MFKTMMIVALLPFLAHAQDTANQALLQTLISKAHENNSSSLVIMQRGRILHSHFARGSDNIQSVASITKSVCALAIGQLIEQKKIPSFDTLMSTWIPSWAHDPLKSKITLRMILNHTSGLPDVITHRSDSRPNAKTVPDFFYHDDYVKEAITTALIAPPGTQFIYSSIGTSLLGPVIFKASGMNVTDFVRKNLFDPLMIHDFKWEKDKAQQEITSGGLFLSTGDLLRLGELMLHEGNYEGREILTAQTFRTLITQDQPFYDYGLLFWLIPQKKIFFAKGVGGQYIVVFPEKGLIAVRTRNLWGLTPEAIDQGKFPTFPDLIAEWK